MEIHPSDADEIGISEGDLVGVESPRGGLRARITGIREGVVFVPFHYGYFDQDDPDGHHRAANELTITQWDPVSKQPVFKTAAARVTKITEADGTPAHEATASAPAAGTTSGRE